MLYNKSPLLLAILMSTLLMNSNSLAETATTAAPNLVENAVTAPQLIQGNWDTFNRQRLNDLITQYGKGSPNYKQDQPPYVVFDWDNTSVFLDIQEILMIYQLEHLRYAMTPEQLNTALHMNIPTTNFTADYNNAAGQPVNIDTITNDIVSSYTWIYNNFDQMQGKKSLAEIKQAPQYQDFVTKMRYLYDAIGDTFDHSVSYPWATYHFTGLTEKDIRELTEKTVEWQKNQPVESVKWTSPDALTGKAGVVSVSWKNGLRLVPEMQDLYAKLREAGFDVYVCSASFVDVIKEIASNPKFNYNNSDQNVIAMELERDPNGIIQTQFRQGYAQTQGKGKTEAITRFLVSKYGYGPIFIAGDSEGDQNMMQDFKDTQLVLIINRLRGSEIGQLSKKAVDTYGQPEAKYLLQGRDDNKGVFLPSQAHFKLGSEEARVLKTP